MQEKMVGAHKSITSGFKKLDRLTTGFYPSELILIAARPAMGKTALALNLVSNAVLKEGKSVLYFSLDLSEEQIKQRLICSECGEILKKPMYIDDTSQMSVNDLYLKAREIQKTHGLHLVVIDYFQLLKGNSTGTGQQDVHEITYMLKELAKELDIPVIVLSQINRSVEARQNKRPMMGDIHEGGSLEQYADVIMFIYREEYYEPETLNNGIAEIIVAKNHNEVVDTVKLGFDKATIRFTDLQKKRVGPKVLILGTCHLSADVLTILHKHNDSLTIMLVEDIEELTYRQELCQIIQSSDMIFVIADMRDKYSSLIGSKMINDCQMQKILTVPVLLMRNKDDEADYIGQPGIISMTFEEIHRQCNLHPEIFSEETDVISGIIKAITDMFFDSGLVGVDFFDVAAAFSLPGKLKPVFGMGVTVEEAVEDLLISAGESRTQANVIALLSFSGASSRKAFLKDVHEAITIFKDKGFNTSHEDFAAAVAVLPDDLLVDKIKVFALIAYQQ